MQHKSADLVTGLTNPGISDNADSTTVISGTSESKVT